MVCFHFLSFAALLGLLFTKNVEAAYSHFQIWQSLGLIIAMAWSSYMCTKTKLILTTVLLVISVSPLSIVLYRMRKN